MPNLIPAELAEIIATHKGLFGGFTMMADDGAPTDPPADPPANPPADAPKDQEPLKEPGLKALQAEREARAKAEAELAALKKQNEDAKLSADEKAAKDLKEAQEQAATAATRALRYEVAAEKGLDLKLAPRLTGSTKEELAADADTLLALVGTGKLVAPQPDPSAGHSGDPKPKSLSEAITAHYTT